MSEFKVGGTFVAAVKGMDVTRGDEYTITSIDYSDSGELEWVYFRDDVGDNNAMSASEIDYAPQRGVVPTHDVVNHPEHYISDPSGVECIQITRHRNFNVGNAIKYLWRNGLKTSSADPLDKQIEDLKKSVWYITDEIARLEATRGSE